MKVTAILLQSINGKLAKNQSDKLDWGGKADKKNFATLTKKVGIMIMGSRTFESMGKFPLLNRKTIVMTRTPEKYETETKKYNSQRLMVTSKEPSQILADISANKSVNEVIIAGGSRIYTQFLTENLIDELIITIAPKIFMSDINSFSEDTWQDTEQMISLEFIDSTMLDDNTIALKYSVVK